MENDKNFKPSAWDAYSAIWREEAALPAITLDFILNAAVAELGIIRSELAGPTDPELIQAIARIYGSRATHVEPDGSVRVGDVGSRPLRVGADGIWYSSTVDDCVEGHGRTVDGFIRWSMGLDTDEAGAALLKVLPSLPQREDEPDIGDLLDEARAAYREQPR
ncbi:hypothetical protein [Inquilinus sp. OTU3971]|uniref:hypothetical protein n=1 Tax=Inquilinus sp. OTU3971 TaxID=3043855 RepID=UPI00313D73BA